MTRKVSVVVDDNVAPGADAPDAPVDGGTLTKTVTDVTATYKRVVRSYHLDAAAADAVMVQDTDEVPGVVVNLATANIGETSLDLSWDALVATPAVTGYLVEYKENAAVTWATFATTASASISITGLTGGTSYDFRVTAQNTIGDGTAAIVTASTSAAGAVPGAVVNLAASNIAQTTVDLSWDALTAFPAVSGYLIEFKATASATWNTFATAGTETATVTGLAAGTAYDFRVTAENAEGSGTPVTISATTAAATAAPGPVSSLVVTATTDSTLALSWAAVTANPTVSGYLVEYKEATSSTWLTLAVVTGTTATLSGLTASTTYDLRVSAQNSVGTSTAATVSAATDAATATAFPDYTAGPILQVNPDLYVGSNLKEKFNFCPNLCRISPFGMKNTAASGRIVQTADNVEFARVGGDFGASYYLPDRFIGADIPSVPAAFTWDGTTYTPLALGDTIPTPTAGATSTSYFYVMSMEEGSTAEDLPLGGKTMVWEFPESWSACVDFTAGAGVSVLSDVTASGTRKVTVQFSAAGTSGNVHNLRLWLGSIPAGGINLGDVYFYEQALEAQKDQLYTDEVLEFFSRFHIIRTLDINNLNYITGAKAAQFFSDSGGRDYVDSHDHPLIPETRKLGVPYNAMIAAAARAQRSMWANVPNVGLVDTSLETNFGNIHFGKAEAAHAMPDGGTNSTVFNITSVEDAGGGKINLVTDAAHPFDLVGSLTGSQRVTVSGTYAGTYNVNGAPDANRIQITATFTGTDTGTVTNAGYISDLGYELARQRYNVATNGIEVMRAEMTDFATRLVAACVAEGYAPTTDLILEYGNEIWNAFGVFGRRTLTFEAISLAINDLRGSVPSLSNWPSDATASYTQHAQGFVTGMFADEVNRAFAAAGVSQSLKYVLAVQQGETTSLTNAYAGLGVYMDYEAARVGATTVDFGQVYSSHSGYHDGAGEWQDNYAWSPYTGPYSATPQTQAEWEASAISAFNADTATGKPTFSALWSDWYESATIEAQNFAYIEDRTQDLIDVLPSRDGIQAQHLGEYEGGNHESAINANLRAVAGFDEWFNDFWAGANGAALLTSRFNRMQTAFPGKVISQFKITAPRTADLTVYLSNSPFEAIPEGINLVSGEKGYEVEQAFNALGLTPVTL